MVQTFRIGFVDSSLFKRKRRQLIVISILLQYDVIFNSILLVFICLYFVLIGISFTVLFSPEGMGAQ